MNRKNTLLVLLLVGALSTTIVSSINAAPKKKTSNATTKKEKVKKTESKKKITPSESFYDKIWEKFKNGSKADRVEVVDTLKKIVKDNPDEFIAYYYLGIMDYEGNSPNTALKYFEKALLGFPKSADIHIRIAKILEEKGKKQEADEHYIEALSIDNTNPKALSKVGIIELRKKNYKKAEEYLIKARESEPDNSDTLRALGETWLELGDYSSAIEILEQVLLFDKQDAKAHLLVGKAYEKRGHSDKAAEHIASAGKYGKKNSEIMEAIGYDFARNLNKSGKFEEAIAAYKKEIKKNDNPALGYYEMAEVYESLEDDNNAIKAYKQAYELDKKLGEGIFRCIELYQAKQDKENVEKMLKLVRSNSLYKERGADMLESIKIEEKLRAETELQNKISDSNTKDAELEEAYLQSYATNKKDADTLEKLYLYYKNRGYYDEAIAWFRRYAKESSMTSHQKKAVESDLKAYLEQDNYYLFGDKKAVSPSKSKTPSDELLNLAFNGENDRQKELALQILLSRKEYKEDRSVVEAMTKFYEKRGIIKEASKYINQMRKLGYLTESEAKTRKARLKD